ncbi:MAG: ASCH domain-containing protein [Tepidisphaeraceae bacterium]
MRALSIRQPYAELILRGIKTAELRSRSTTIIGGRFYIYAPLRRAQDWAKAKAKTPICSDDLWVATPPPPLWMIELAEQVKLIEPGATLPTGVIVGSAVIEKVTAVESTGGDPSEAGPLFRWHLVDVERTKRFRKPKGHPQPVWFTPFRGAGTAPGRH